ncbi:MAG: hypothetical protein ACC682_11480, partial [Gemmatimonadota bacterium]
MKSTLFRDIAALGAAAVLSTMALPAGRVAAQDVRIEDSAVTLSSGSSGRAELWLQLEDGEEHRLAFVDGEIALDGQTIGRYEPRGTLLGEWREFLREYAGADASDLQTGLIEWGERVSDRGASASDDEGNAAASLGRKLLDLLREIDETDARTSEASGARGVAARSQLTIAPGGVEFDELLGELDRLRSALGQLGSAAGDATDDLALIVHDDYAIGDDEMIAGNLALLDGTLEIGGDVVGSVLVLDGTLVLADGARVEGDILLVGGELEFAGELATIEGEIVFDFPAIAVAPTTPAPEATPVVAVEETSRATDRQASRNPVRRFIRNLGRAAEELFGAVSTFITLGAIGLLLVYFFQGRVETVADTVRHEFARSFAMGLAAEVLFFPALLILLVLVITWPIVPFFVLGTGLAMLAGYVAVAHGAGEMFAQRRYRYEWLERMRRSNSYYYVLSGLVLLLLPFAATAVLW